MSDTDDSLVEFSNGLFLSSIPLSDDVYTGENLYANNMVNLDYDAPMFVLDQILYTLNHYAVQGHQLPPLSESDEEFLDHLDSDLEHF